jgi:hypothetical protein
MSVILNEVKNLVESMGWKTEILRLMPQNDITTQPLEGGGHGWGWTSISHPPTLILPRKGGGGFECFFHSSPSMPLLERTVLIRSLPV